VRSTVIEQRLSCIPYLPIPDPHATSGLINQMQLFVCVERGAGSGGYPTPLPILHARGGWPPALVSEPNGHPTLARMSATPRPMRGFDGTDRPVVFGRTTALVGPEFPGCGTAPRAGRLRSVPKLSRNMGYSKGSRRLRHRSPPRRELWQWPEPAAGESHRGGHRIAKVARAILASRRFPARVECVEALRGAWLRSSPDIPDSLSTRADHRG